MSAMNPDGYVSVQRERTAAVICVFAAAANDVAGRIAGLVSRRNARARLAEFGRRLPTSILGVSGAHSRREA